MPACILVWRNTFVGGFDEQVIDQDSWLPRETRGPRCRPAMFDVVVVPAEVEPAELVASSALYAAGAESVCASAVDEACRDTLDQAVVVPNALAAD